MLSMAAMGCRDNQHMFGKSKENFPAVSDARKKASSLQTNGGADVFKNTV